MDFLGFPVKVDERNEAERLRALASAQRCGVGASFTWFQEANGNVTLVETFVPLDEIAATETDN